MFNKKDIRLEIQSRVPDDYSSCYKYVEILKSEFPNLAPKHNITEDELNSAIDTIIGYFIQEHTQTILVNLEERNLACAELKEMTMDEIEKELGYKIKLKGDSVRIAYDDNDKPYLRNEKYYDKEKNEWNK